MIIPYKYKINEEERKQIIKETIEKNEKISNLEKINNKDKKILNDIQIVFLIDISGSMMNGDKDFENDNKCNRYHNVIKSVNQIIKDIFKYDKDNKVPIYFFDDDVKHLNIIDPKNFIQMCINYAPTKIKTGKKMFEAIQMAFENEINDTENILFIIFTDGYIHKDQGKKIGELIYSKISNKDPSGNRLNVLFVRIGDEKEAIHFLKYVDDNEKIAKNVDTKSDNALYKMQNEIIILNAIYEKLDDIYQKL